MKIMVRDTQIVVTPIDRPGFEYIGQATKGPWNDEPDAFKFSMGDYPCVGFRTEAGIWCGYVGSLDAKEEFAEPWGGVTFYSRKQVIDDILGFPQDLIIWNGFDCAQFGDYIPAMPDHGERENYRTLEFVVQELHDMVTFKRGKVCS